MVPLGYPAEQAGPRRLRAVKEMVHYEDFES
jgi:hypothetical protein